MTEIRIPQLNANDDEYTLIEWLTEDGGFVAQGQPFVVVETSKATEEIEMPEPGFVRHAATALRQYPVSAVIAHRFSSEQEARGHRMEEPHDRRVRDSGAGTGPAAYILTDGARVLADEHGIAGDRIAGLNRRMVRAEDIRTLIDETRPTDPGPDQHQRGVAAVVTRSHREIPAAHAVIRVTLDAAERLRAAVAERTGVVIGVAELVIAATGRAAADFPRLYAPFGRDPAAADDVHVGVTTDMGTGLFLPVIPAGRDLPEIAERLLDARRKALRRSFTVRDLGDGGHIAVSLNTDPDIVLALPIVFPQHSCMVSVGGTLSELVLDEAGAVRSRPYLHLGLSYDHRVVNGREAMSYLRRLKGLLEDAAFWLPPTNGDPA
jgi:2-oxoglutarate dehydrogenase E2 component (dihydrolipoamide succinyltransferase)